MSVVVNIVGGGGVDNLSLPALLLCHSIAVILMVTAMNEKSARKPRNVKINPQALLRARIEGLRSGKTTGEWLEEAIEEKIEKELSKAK